VDGRIDKGWERKDRVKIEIIFKYAFSEQVEIIIH